MFVELLWPNFCIIHLGDEDEGNDSDTENNSDYRESEDSKDEELQEFSSDGKFTVYPANYS